MVTLNFPATTGIYSRRQRQRLKLEMIEAYGGKCACCGETDSRFLTLEHKRGGGNAHRDQFYDSAYGVYRELKKLGWPTDDYEVLCYNCNMVKRNGFPCPHKVKPMQWLRDDIIKCIRDTAAKYALDPVVMLSIAEQESMFDNFALRYEPAFMAKYVAPLYTNNKISATEAFSRSMSWGIFQLMGQVARDFGFQGRFLSELTDVPTNTELACRVFKHKLDANGGDLVKGLLLWNGGGNPLYPTQVLARRPHYALG